ncbi:MAG: transporter substrate-binding domain-containing protein [Bradyrhizobium sp.]|nr:transporter substrate-binding domain-containing protein [Bradyrhizobium sp.]
MLLRACLILILFAGSVEPATAQSELPKTIVLARLSHVPDQRIGGEIVKAIYAKLGISVTFTDVEAARALELSSSGAIDGEIQRIDAVADQYPTLIRIETPINYIEPSAFTRTLTFKVDGWGSIADYDLGIVHGVGSSERGTKGMKSVQMATSLENLILMLDHDRFQIMITDRLSGEVTLKRMGLSDRIHALSPPLQHIDLYHYLNEKHQALAKRVSAVVAEMAASGELEKLHKQLVDQILAEADTVN